MTSYSQPERAIERIRSRPAGLHATRSSWSGHDQRDGWLRERISARKAGYERLDRLSCRAQIERAGGRLTRQQLTGIVGDQVAVPRTPLTTDGLSTQAIHVSPVHDLQERLS